MATGSTATRKKSSRKKSTGVRKKTAGVRKKSSRKYSPAASETVHEEMKAYKKGTARSGPGGKGGKVKSRKQAIAIGLSEARKAGKKVPSRPGGSKKKS
jgi:hypothetical protein